MAMIWPLSKPLRFNAPERQEETQSPHPLHRTGLIAAVPAKGPFSWNDAALKGHMETHMPQPLHLRGSAYAIVPLVIIVFRARSVTARDAAAWACAIDSSMGLG